MENKTANQSQEVNPAEASPNPLDPTGIRQRAYAKWESAGCPCGDGVEFWLEAEVELLAEARSENSDQAAE